MRTLSAALTVCLAMSFAAPAMAEIRSGVEKARAASSVEACTAAEEKAHDRMNSPTVTIPFNVTSSKVEACECGKTGDDEWTCSVEWGMSLEKR